MIHPGAETVHDRGSSQALLWDGPQRELFQCRQRHVPIGVAPPPLHARVTTGRERAVPATNSSTGGVLAQGAGCAGDETADGRCAYGADTSGTAAMHDVPRMLANRTAVVPLPWHPPPSPWSPFAYCPLSQRWRRIHLRPFWALGQLVPGRRCGSSKRGPLRRPRLCSASTRRER